MFFVVNQTVPRGQQALTMVARGPNDRLYLLMARVRISRLALPAMKMKPSLIHGLKFTNVGSLRRDQIQFAIACGASTSPFQSFVRILPMRSRVAKRFEFSTAVSHAPSKIWAR